MRKLASIILIIFVLLFTLMPGLTFADKQTPPAAKPYEKVVAKKGSWYTEQIAFDNNAVLVVGYTGDYRIDGSLLSEQIAGIEFSTREDFVLKGVYLPYGEKAPEAVIIQFQDSKGNIYGPYATQSDSVNRIREESNANKDELNQQSKNVNYVLIPQNEIVLPSGKYTLEISSPELQVRTSDTGGAGAFLIKGVNNSANEKYKKDLQEWEVKDRKSVV